MLRKMRNNRSPGQKNFKSNKDFDGKKKIQNAITKKHFGPKNVSKKNTETILFSATKNVDMTLGHHKKVWTFFCYTGFFKNTFSAAKI